MFNFFFASTDHFLCRDSNSLLQACKQVHTLHSGEVGDPRLEAAKRAVSVNQHHDAVTGTAKQHVTDDYALRLHKVSSVTLHSLDMRSTEHLSRVTLGVESS